MKIFLSGIDADKKRFKYVDARIDKYYYMLMSFFYLNQEIFDKVCNKSDEVLIDSGAHTLQQNSTRNFDSFLERYISFIKKNDNPKVIGYFELDVDNKIGYDRVKEYRDELEKVSDKIIPVWHKNRGINDYIEMCERYSGKIVAITGFRNEDITDEQYLSFLKVAIKYKCKLHCLGCTRKNILDKIPFYSVDSASWCYEAVFGRLLLDVQGHRRHLSRNNYREIQLDVALNNFKVYQELQLLYKYKFKEFDKKYYE